jgi:hypothetical protein
LKIAPFLFQWDVTSHSGKETPCIRTRIDPARRKYATIRLLAVTG